MRITIGEYILQHFYLLGTNSIFGVPGDYNLSFLEIIEDKNDMTFINNCNELNASYAADGFARSNGLGGLVVTYGVGDLAALSGVAGAYAESVPVVCISGTPPLSSMNNNALLHHTLADGNFENIMNCFKEFTVAQAVITPTNASFEIPRLFATCVKEKKPVYLQLPSDICDIEIEVSLPITLNTHVSSDKENFNLAANLLVSKVKSAQHPVIIIDQMVERFGLEKQVQALSEQYSIPFANMPTAKCALSENTKGWLGTYVGDLSRPELLALVDKSDCIITIGVRLVDSTTAYFSHKLNQDVCIELQPYSIMIGNNTFNGINCSELLEHLSRPTYSDDAASAHKSELVRLSDNHRELPAETQSKLTHEQLWQRVAHLIKADDIIAAENGTAGAAVSGIRMPDGVKLLNQPIWGSIGYTLPALLGSMAAKPDSRHMLFIGDGSIQLVAQELSTMLRLEQKPIIFVVNNDGYTIERYILGEDSSYNDIAQWDYVNLPKVFAPKAKCIQHKVQTVEQLEQALADIDNNRDHLIFIELVVDRMDAPPVLKTFCHRVNQFNFGMKNIMLKDEVA
ncbi:thiamine pyrophosphate-binding protein [Pseudoalteromonas sp. MSK9-3]|uniref:alpha-keto acid decarboxylase family protein n=1 Tax=Pseudoalteromonas sp. MSK9-3 TaxID=1897633 RepID=UPI000E6CC493|nr:thiamine pyrophosphate-binding protein [Pseudoalteromonas sp. MSK9-3]RJE77173.1 thiamine pyrophosphate-binding protein [Pseudoalteromonas sp. MSK9-3]